MLHTISLGGILCPCKNSEINKSSEIIIEERPSSLIDKSVSLREVSPPHTPPDINDVAQLKNSLHIKYNSKTDSYCTPIKDRTLEEYSSRIIDLHVIWKHFYPAEKKTNEEFENLFCSYIIETSHDTGHFFYPEILENTTKENDMIILVEAYTMVLKHLKSGTNNISKILDPVVEKLMENFSQIVEWDKSGYPSRFNNNYKSFNSICTDAIPLHLISNPENLKQQISNYCNDVTFTNSFNQYRRHPTLHLSRPVNQDRRDKVFTKYKDILDKVFFDLSKQEDLNSCLGLLMCDHPLPNCNTRLARLLKNAFLINHRQAILPHENMVSGFY